MFKIGLISIKDNSGCTSLGIHIANFLASESRSVTLYENKNKEEFKTVKAFFEEDGTFLLNNVRYVPSGVEKSIPSDVEIHIIGCVNFLSEFDESFDKIYLCTDASVENIPDIKEYFHETNTKADLLLLGASKEQLDTYTEQGFRCINIGKKREDNIPFSLANHISLTMRMKGLTPPIYNKDAFYEKTVFNWKPEEENNSGFFGMFSKKKKTKEERSSLEEDNKDSDTLINTEAEEDPEEESSSRIYQRSVKTEEYAFVDVPAPTMKTKELSDSSKKEVSTKTIVKEVVKEDPALKEELKKKQEIIKEKERQTKVLEKKAKEKEKEEKKKEQELKKAQEENEKLHYKATHDELCGIKNRTGFEEDVKDLKQYVLIMFDVNNLKVTNDTLGHKNGDKLLKTIVKTITETFSELYRYGGDEFIGIVRGASKRDEAKIKDNLFLIDETLDKLSAKEKSLNYSVAHGYAFSSEGNISRVKELADERMYKDKATKKAVKEDAKTENVSIKEEEKAVEKKSFFSAFRLNKNDEKITDTLKVNHFMVFVTGISHSVGTSFVAGSLASSMTDIYNEDVYLELTEGGEYPDNYMVKPVATDEDRFSAFKSKIYVEEKGIYPLLSDTDLGDMLRADLDIMVTTASENDLKELAKFIKQNKEMAANWLFAFNHVHKTQEKVIASAMKYYNYVIIPFHDNAEVDLDLRKTYIKVLDEFIG